MNDWLVGGIVAGGLLVGGYLTALGLSFYATWQEKKKENERYKK